MIRRLLLVIAFLLAIFSSLLVISPAQAQSAPGVNKYLVANAPAVPTPTTSFTIITAPETDTTYTYVIDVIYYSTAPITITDTLPAGFVATGCSVFVNYAAQTGVSGCPASGTPSATIGPFTPSGTPPLRIIVYLTGKFTTGGQKLNEVSVTGGGGTATAEVDTWVDTLPPAYNLKLEKTADKTVIANGDTILYTTTIANTSTVDVNLGGIIALFDRVTNASAANELQISWTWLNCVASTDSTCMTPPLPQAAQPQAMLPGESFDIFSTSPTSVTGIPADPAQAGGIIKAGGTMTITYAVQVETQDPCAYGPVSLKNSAYLSLGSGSGNFPDSVPTDNEMEVSSAMTGLSTTCPPPALKVTKTTPTLTPTWGASVPYQITVTNISGVPVLFRYEDWVRVNPAITVVSANYVSGTCAPTPCDDNVYSPLTWIGSAFKKLFERKPSAGMIALTASGTGSSFTIDYTVEYGATCAVATGAVKIENQIRVRALVAASTPYIFQTSIIRSVKLPALPQCKLKVTKVWKPTPSVNPATPLNFGVPVGTYQVKWENTSSAFGMQLGSLWDVMHIDSPLYATVPLSFSPRNCVYNLASGTDLLANSTGTNVSPSTTAWQGAKAIQIIEAEFQINGDITCEFGVTAHRPLPTDPNCQAAGMPKLWNTALADIDPAYNPNNAPWQSATVSKRLPLCLNLTINKSPSPSPVLPGDPVNWTITIKNNGPVGNAPINSFAIQDFIPPGLIPLAANPTCTAPVGATCSTAFISPLMLATVNNLDVNQTATIKFTSTTPTAPPQCIKNEAAGSLLTGYGYYYHPRPIPKGSGTACTAWPTLTKAFSQPKIFGNATPVSLTFTITNLAYTPAVNGMSFSEKLPLGIDTATQTLSACGGTVSVVAGGSGQAQISLTAGTLPVTTLTCQFTVPITYKSCGTFTNTNNNLVGTPVKLTPQLGATLTVACLKQLTGNGIDTPAYNGYGCALYDAGDIKCWGTGPLARGTSPTTAALATGHDPADQIDAGPTHMCAVTKTGKVQCWGQNNSGQLGDGTFASTIIPSGYVEQNTSGFPDLTNVVQVSAGGFTSCAVTTAGEIWCWGRTSSAFPYLPRATQVKFPNALEMFPNVKAVQVSVSTTHACALLNNGRAICWGEQRFGALGNFNAGSASVQNPVVVLESSIGPPLGKLREIKAGINYTCAILGNLSQRVMCWGRNNTVGNGILSNVLATSSPANPQLQPAIVTPLPTTLRHLVVTDSPSGQLHNCVTAPSLLPTLRIRCWGSDANNQLESGPTANWKGPGTVAPQPILISPAVTGPIDASNGKTCAIVGTAPLNATVSCWGSRALGFQIGDGANAPPTTSAVTVTGIP